MDRDAWDAQMMVVSAVKRLAAAQERIAAAMEAREAREKPKWTPPPEPVGTPSPHIRLDVRATDG